jgi:hypothetical protein
MDYIRYIASSAWAVKRKARLILDGYRCRLCDEDGSRFGLEVHHRPGSYAKMPDESVEDDLITVCSRCHALITSSIREDRYGRRELEPTIQPDNIQVRQEISYGMARDEVQIDWIGPVYITQRADGRPNEQVVKVDKADFLEAHKDRRGL